MLSQPEFKLYVVYFSVQCGQRVWRVRQELQEVGEPGQAQALWMRQGSWVSLLSLLLQDQTQVQPQSAHDTKTPIRLILIYFHLFSTVIDSIKLFVKRLIMILILVHKLKSYLISQSFSPYLFVYTYFIHSRKIISFVHIRSLI